VARTIVNSQNTPAQSGVPEECDWKNPDDDAVTNIIETALGGSRSTHYTANRLWNVWQTVRDMREKPDGSNCCNADLAAAEHYLYSRYSVTHRDYDPAFMKLAIWFYGLFKFFFPHSGICPKSPDTESQQAWADRGADDAMIDIEYENSEREKWRHQNEYPLGGNTSGPPGQQVWHPPGSSQGGVPMDW
jgi:hypothetical protein